MTGAITTQLGKAISYVGEVVSALVTNGGALAPLMGIIGLGIAMGVLGFAIRTIKSLVWGF